ncbi:DUF6220 domain-containing protein [Paenibacillus aurantius]|uniref:DUF6220 domain-containing protein n=1 Tax=Paenibacillus aurantius TaxID=2918900 RepID=A0AA96LDW6_9BACL|nr:DUF6220 domain-containing protein [Paenibacillus aurantius]WNQ12234.1 DUF6220 domain-containing protein [Paenibacillus aurantius]
MSNLSVNRRESEAGDRPVELTSLSSFVVGARLVFKVMVRLFAVCLLLQVFLAGLALFWDPARWASHTGFARLLILVSVLILVVSFIARLPLALRLRSAGLFGIILLIAVSAKLPSGIGYLSALHPVLALLLFMGTVSLARKTDAFQRERKQEAAKQNG